MTLYQYSHEYANLFEQAENIAEIDDASARADVENTVIEMLNALETEFTEKAESVACFIKNTDSEAKAIDLEIKALQARKKAKENLSDRLRDYLKEQMLTLGTKKVETAKAVISIRNTAESVKIADEHSFINWCALNDDSLLKFAEPTVNKTAVKEALKAGRILDGAYLESGKSVTIK